MKAGASLRLPNATLLQNSSNTLVLLPLEIAGSHLTSRPEGTKRPMLPETQDELGLKCAGDAAKVQLRS